MNKNSVITLTTDYGTKDHFLAVLKAKIIQQNPNAQIIDISHEINPFQIHEAAYILSNAFHHFPKGSVHLVDIDSEKTEKVNHIAFKYLGHYFVGPNNGIFSMMMETEKFEFLTTLSIDRIMDFHHVVFPAKDIFVTAATHLSKGGTFEVIGHLGGELVHKKPLTASFTNKGRQLIANVIYIDRMGNVILNIKKPYFESCRSGRSFSITSFKKGAARSNRLQGRKLTTELAEINHSYSQNPKQEGDVIAIFNSSDYLEIAISRHDANLIGGAALILGLKYGDSVQINFYDY
ncbi:MAG: SAM-dependent chlorinase/fluorinase [Flavobacteriales bacterium]|nr:SAM-dependent chlorinase/fluorinase [Flavobacteriales bacterium]